MTAGMCMTSPLSVHELAGTAGNMIFNGLANGEKEFRFLFAIINSGNSHWHLVATDMERKVFMHLNSIKRNAKYKSNAKKWQNIVGPMFHIYCNNNDVMKWPMEENVDCPSQPSGSLDCGLYCLKYMKFLARRDKPDHWDFTQDDISVYRRQLGARILKEGLNQKIQGVLKI